ncbi:MAG: hypothetical protein E7047_08855 [Lentisphaerae bacterium]|nr:hypothetical protein [Lentisphaerota bacterium]
MDQTDNNHIAEKPISMSDSTHMSSYSSVGDQTQLAMPLSDSAGNEISPDELKTMLGTESSPSISVLQDMTPIGMGGIGAVFSARDPVLHREIAIKILRPAYRNQLNYVTSFIREARITAQIDHPNVIPVHQLGMFDDAGTYFTMKRIQGVTLANILRKLKEGNAEQQKVYTRQRLLEIFVSVCNGVAFAHSKGIIHRDLKPANIMVGDYGEVFIADWGLAIYREENDNSSAKRKIELGVLPEDAPVDETADSANKISGTPAFMAPEQVTGKTQDVDEQSDVYALGTILYSILTWEPSPFDNASTVTQLMQDVVHRKFKRPRRRAPQRHIPHELEAITLKAMHHDKKQRYATVIDLLNDIRNHLGKYPVSAYSPLGHKLFKLIRRRPLVPITLLAAALTLLCFRGAESLQNYLTGRTLIREFNTSLGECESSLLLATSSRQKLNEFFRRTGQTGIHGEATSLRSRYLRASNEFDLAANNCWENLQQLLNITSDYHSIAPLFAKLLSTQTNFAHSIDDQAMLAQTANRLRQLPPELTGQIYKEAPQLKEQIRRFNDNQGNLLLAVPSANVKLSAIPLTLEQTDLQTEKIELRPAPTENLLKAGYYLVSADYPNGHTIQFPVSVASGNVESIKLIMPEKMPDSLVYIPEGHFIFGERTFDNHQEKIRLSGFFIMRNEVTMNEYLEFWKSIESPELRERYRAYVDDTASRRRKLMPLWDESGHLYAPYTGQMPVIGLTSEAMEAYCRYMSSKYKLKYRLPTALEWEKAARGVDGRDYVWGNDFDSGKVKLNYSGEIEQTLYPAAVGSASGDCSIYGVYDLTGNARELVINPGNVSYYTVKGSSFRLTERFARLTSHGYASNPSDVGFRCVVELPQ